MFDKILGVLYTSCMFKKSSKTFEFAQRIKKMKKHQSFDVDTKGDRTLVIQAATSLRAIGAIEFQITTRANDKGGFTVYAL